MCSSDLGRPKDYFSIYQKMIVRGHDFANIYDLVGVRIIVDTIQDCYVEVTRPSVSSPISLSSVSDPRNLAETVRHILPTFSGFCKTEFVAVTRDTDFSSEVEAALNEAAER